MEQGVLKLIAIILSEPVFTRIKEEQHFIADRWGPKHALRTPPHITIIPPVAFDKIQVGVLEPLACMMAAMAKPFSIQLNGYGSFNSSVIFIEPDIPEELQKLHDSWRQVLLQKIPTVLDKYPDRPYHPHMTLAHKDVTPTQFGEMWAYYRDRPFLANWEATSFWILNHASGGWIPEKEFTFRK